MTPRRRDRKRLRTCRRIVRDASCTVHVIGYYPLCAECREARTAAWDAMQCPPMHGRWFRGESAAEMGRRLGYRL